MSTDVKELLVVFTGDMDLTGLTALVGFIGRSMLCDLKFVLLSSEIMHDSSPVTVLIVLVVVPTPAWFGSVSPRRLKTDDPPF